LNHYSAEEADFETYRYILKNTEKQPNEYLKIFLGIPKESRAKIVKFLGYNDEKEFRSNFSKQLNVYRQSSFRIEQEYAQGGENEDI
jgi:hypothetical protein